MRVLAEQGKTIVLATNDRTRDGVGESPCGACWLNPWLWPSKDLRAEFRTRVAINSLGLFALTILAAVSYTVGPYRIAAEDRPFLLAVLLWIVIFFAALAGLDRSFVKEEESHTAPLLRLGGFAVGGVARQVALQPPADLHADGHPGAALLHPHGLQDPVGRDNSSSFSLLEATRWR